LPLPNITCGQPATTRCLTAWCLYREPASGARCPRRVSATANLDPAGVALRAPCIRAIDRGLTAGSHGLPLMGAGDWNDGLNRVGRPAW
jgi:cyclic beta-1,2-glucan synthetase